MNRTESAIFLREVFDFSEVPRTAVITGSGQDGALSFLTERQELPFSEIPYFTSSTVPGHGSKLIVGRCGGRQVLALCGRRHRYEGCTMEEIVLSLIHISRYDGPVSSCPQPAQRWTAAAERKAV